VNPLDYLFGLEFFGIKLGLENIRNLMNAAGNPQDSLTTIHVAGTNGKGSTLAFLDSILQESGYRTGRFTSPHLIEVNERFLLDSIPINDETLDRIILQYKTLAEKNDLSPTFFEINTAIAFQYFADEKVNIALIETGLGGRFDSTNIIKPFACAITHIGLDHMQFLGNTLGEIAFEKAGIIKMNTPVVVGPIDEEAMVPIARKATEENAPVWAPTDGYSFSTSKNGTFSYESQGTLLTDVTLSMPGVFQPANAAIATALALQLKVDFPKITTATIRKGLETATWPGRMEVIPQKPPIIMDAAHNLEAMEALEQSLESRCVVVLGLSNDKPGRAMIESILPKSEVLILTQFDGHRAYDTDTLSKEMGSTPHETMPELELALGRGLEMAKEKDIPLLITGSLFTIGQARKILQDQELIPKLAFR